MAGYYAQVIILTSIWFFFFIISIRQSSFCCSYPLQRCHQAFNVSIPAPSQRSARNDADHDHVKQFVTIPLSPTSDWLESLLNRFSFVVRLFYRCLVALSRFNKILRIEVFIKGNQTPPVFACFYEIRTFTTMVSFTISPL